MLFLNTKESMLLLILSIIYQGTCAVSVTKNVTINRLNHQIMGTSSIINEVTIEYYAKIPYALPPIGPLRFKYPQKIKGQAWNGIYNATDQPNTCWQAGPGDFDLRNPAARIWISNTTMSEDCLYLTIWAPKISATKIPVMVWIYGGSFLSGSSTLEVYDGSILASRHNVIVVSMQYRVGPLGFMYLDGDTIPGNQGLMDQRMALRWIKDNIQNFNGDADTITIFGESAGSASVSLQVLSPLTRNLFKRAIMESGTVLSPWSIETKEESKTKALELAKNVNCGQVIDNMTKLIECFNKVDPMTLTNLQYNLKEFLTKQRVELLMRRGNFLLSSDVSYFLEFYFKPIYDNYFIPGTSSSLLSSINKRKNIDLLMGFNANEGMYFLLYGLNSTLNLLRNGTVVMTDLLSSSTRNYKKASTMILENLSSPKYMFNSMIPLLMYEYQVPSDTMGYTQWDSLAVMSAFDQMTADEHFVCPVVTFAQAMSANNQVYLYNFRHQTSSVTFPKWVGTMHGYEIEYVFGMPFSDRFTKSYYKFNEDEKILSEAVMTYWTNFAKYGNPTPRPATYFNQNVSWNPYKMSEPNLFHFSISNEVPFRPNDKSRQCRFWSTVLPALIDESNKMSTSSSIIRRHWTLMTLAMVLLTAKLY